MPHPPQRMKVAPLSSVLPVWSTAGVSTVFLLSSSLSLSLLSLLFSSFSLSLLSSKVNGNVIVSEKKKLEWDFQRGKVQEREKSLREKIFLFLRSCVWDLICLMLVIATKDQYPSV